MASAFIDSSTTSSTMIAAEVFSTKPRLTSSDQRKICIGSTVEGEQMPPGTSPITARIPTSSSGAVSPRARHADDRAGPYARQGSADKRRVGKERGSQVKDRGA